MTSITVFAPAKINLNLNIVGRSSCGLHLIESIFIFHDSVFDEITITPSNKLEINFLDAKIDNQENTIYKAVTLLAEFAKQEPNFFITIKKNIPIASGMGGGSADAAAVIKHLCKIWKIDLDSRIYEIAKQISSDVPACLYGSPSLVTATGDQIEKLINFPLLNIILVNPGIYLSSKKVFQKYAELKQGNFSESKINIFKKINPLTHNNILKIIQNSKNNLEEAAINLGGWRISQTLSDINSQSGCLLARISGSGPTCFGVFNNKDNTYLAFKKLQKKYPWVK